MSWDIAVSNEKEMQFVEDKIISFNSNQVPFTQEKDFIDLNFHVKNENGMVIAGINSLMYCWGMLYINVLFVEESHRGQHLGVTWSNRSDQPS